MGRHMYIIYYSMYIIALHNGEATTIHIQYIYNSIHVIYTSTHCHKVEISADCKFMSLAGQTTLAGSCCSLLNTLHSLVNVLKVPLGEAVTMISENPAR